LINAAISGQISIGQITFFLTSITTLGSDLNQLSFILTDHSGASQRVAEMRGFLDEIDEKRVFTSGISALNTPALIQLEGVSFNYPNSSKKVIKNINLEIKPGEKIAIVGENGAGKTTLVKLISNIYPVSKGKITVDGRDLNEISSESWFNNIGVLHQDYNTYPDLNVKE